MQDIGLKKRKKLQATSSKPQAWQPVPEMVGWNYERNIMAEKQLKRIADALEEILRLVEKDMAEMKKAAKWKKLNHSKTYSAWWRP